MCSTMLDVHKLHKLENSVDIILCNLEKIFPPVFFDSMEHLIIHLPYENMPPIVEAYIVEEIDLFTSQYFELDVQSKRSMPQRNDECTSSNDGFQVSIFNYPGKASGAMKKRWLSGLERHIVNMYILTNWEVVTPYYETYLNELYQHHHSTDLIIDRLVSTEFKDWFKARKATEVSLLGSQCRCDISPSYFVNGYNFQTERHNIDKSTMNCRVCVKSSSYTDKENNFYGIIEKIIQLTYPLIPNLHIVLFKCRWVDPVRGMKVPPSYHLVDVNFKKLYQKDYPFILAQQAVQVYFTKYPSLKRDKADWMVVCKIKAQRVVADSKWTQTVAYQSEEVVPVPIVAVNNQSYVLRDPNGVQVVLEAAGTSRRQLHENDEENEDSGWDDNTDDEEYEAT
ncbi:hypothetical protein Sango_1564900 [Sesamum angolense]|uniref:DUF4216 domain-containing protein n=1 Tax=Sesamum angolense TaxID=2727404 RepID=A0AAE1WPC5_9LAMI|nr:hypothetical protein Sango_1564900 [Sesamum angolense]